MHSLLFLTIMNATDIKKQFNSIAKEYDEGRRCFIPCFDDFYTRSLSLLKEIKPTANKIADLGAGTGLLSMELYKLFSDAKFVLLDLSEEMLRVAMQRFDGMDNFCFSVDDYTDHLPDRCDIIASALSIHHLENEQKASLYTRVFSKLNKGGCFINLDQFCGQSPIISEAYDRWWFNYIGQSGITDQAKQSWLTRKKLDREVSIEHTIELLHKAGFVHAECIYSFMKFGTVIAVK